MLWYAVVAVLLLVGSCPTGAEAGGAMEDTVKDLYDAPSERQARFFLNYDKAAAFNTSVAFTIPLFSFTLPGASDTSAAGMDLQAFGALAFVALFLLGGLGVAIYTTTQAGAFEGRDFGSSRGETSYQESLLTILVTESLAGLPNVVDTESCAQLAVCGAHADPSKYGLLAWPVRFLVPSASEIPEEELTLYQKAARFGEEQEEAEVECQFQYPCLVQPLDLLLYIYDYWYGEE